MNDIDVFPLYKLIYRKIPWYISYKEGEVAGDTVAKAYEKGNITAVEDYVMRDVKATHQLFEKLKGYIL